MTSPLEHRLQIAQWELDDLIYQVNTLEENIAHELKVAANTQSPLLHLTHALRESIESLTMDSLDTILNRAEWTAKEAAKKKRKYVDIHRIGNSLFVDRSTVSLLGDILSQWVQNSIENEIEFSEERQSRGKPTRGSIEIGFQIKNGDIHLLYQSDGKSNEKKNQSWPYLYSKFSVVGLRTGLRWVAVAANEIKEVQLIHTPDSGFYSIFNEPFEGNLPYVQVETLSGSKWLFNEVGTPLESFVSRSVSSMIGKTRVLPIEKISIYGMTRILEYPRPVLTVSL